LHKPSRNIKAAVDKLKIKQALFNLLNNSVEAIGKKKGRIEITLEEDVKMVMVKITDNGSGMRKEEQDMIFEEDYSSKEGGTGLGLFIVRRIIELHRGEIHIHSEKGKGTTVIMKFLKNVNQT
jgi:signal transduction histidine kinase